MSTYLIDKVEIQRDKEDLTSHDMRVSKRTTRQSSCNLLVLIEKVKVDPPKDEGDLTSPDLGVSLD
jgi:CHAD domain-containing protein